MTLSGVTGGERLGRDEILSAGSLRIETFEGSRRRLRRTRGSSVSRVAAKRVKLPYSIPFARLERELVTPLCARKRSMPWRGGLALGCINALHRLN
jgi:hypothetical protein